MFEREMKTLAAAMLVASLSLGTAEGLRAQSALTQEQIDSLARYGKVIIYNGPDPEGYGILGYGGFVWDSADGTNNLCTIGHVGNFDGPWKGLFENRGIGSDPAICMEVNGGIEDAPALSTDGVQVGETVFMLNRELDAVVYFTVSEATESMAKLEALNPGSDRLPENGDSGTLAYKQNAAGDILAVGVYSGRDIVPNRDDPGNPRVIYNAALFGEVDS
jgi:hypothetical protein